MPSIFTFAKIDSIAWYKSLMTFFSKPTRYLSTTLALPFNVDSDLVAYASYE